MNWNIPQAKGLQCKKGNQGFNLSTDLDEEEILRCSAPKSHGLAKFSFYIAV